MDFALDYNYNRRPQTAPKMIHFCKYMGTAKI